MALEFARKYQPTILIIDRRDDLFDSLRIQLKNLNCIALFRKTDLSDDKSVADTIKYIQTTFTKIDMFIYNAGIVIPKLTFESTLAENQLVMKVNYFTTAEMINGLEKQL